MRRSEIFESFIKIAQEKGMISNDSSDSKKKLEETGRADSLDLSAIEALYGVKPDAPKGMEYKKNIIEDAHPNSVVVSPSYDKLNGLVENNNERQNILLHIVQKTPDGLLTQRKYAEKELLLSLVRIGNDLDNRNQDQLRTLADTCLMQVSDKPLKKEAWVIPVIIGVAVLFGALYLKQHMRFISDGLDKDHAKLMGEMDDLINSNSDWGVGYKYRPEFLQQMQSFKNELTQYYSLFRKVAPIIDEIEKPRTASELADFAKQQDKVNVIYQAYQTFRAATEELLPKIMKIEADFASEDYKQRQIQDKGWMSSMVDSTQILHGGKGLIADDFDDVRHALETYVLDIKGVMKILTDAESFKKEVTNQLQQASYKSTEMFGSGPNQNEGGSSAPAFEMASMPGGAGGGGKRPQTVEDLDKEADELSKMLGGHGFSG